MIDYDYTYTFDHIGEQLKKGHISLTNHATNETCTLQVAVNDDQLPFIHYQATPPLLADLIDIAASVHMADRLSKNIEDMPRRMLLRIPLRQLEIIDKPSIHEKLQDILYWFTGDMWSFEFLPYTKYDRSAQLNTPLPFSTDADHPTHVALWSGGLDSFAGVYQELRRDNFTHYTLFGTGSNDIISHTQMCTAQSIDMLFPKRTKLIQLPFRLRDKHRSVKKSSSARSRGFVFMLLGAVCACQEGQNSLYIYENGIGAINLPFRLSEVGLDHSRSVHPLSLISMGELVSSILGQPFFFENPFLFWTKAQMCKEPLQQGANRAVFSTISCDSRHRKYRQPIQCGYCSSCLLRRQAITVNGMVDQTRYQIAEGSGRQRRPDDGTHYYAMIAQVDIMRMLLAADDKWQQMSRHYTSLEDIVEKMDGLQTSRQESILHLYQNYVDEWDSVKHIIGSEFLE